MSLAGSHQVLGFFEDQEYGRTIAGQIPDVLPRLPVEVVADALRRLPRDEFDRALRDKLFPLVVLPGLTLYAASGEAALALARSQHRKVVAETALADFHAALRQTHGPLLLRDATFGLARAQPGKSASRRFSPRQIAVGLLLLAMTAAACLMLPGRVTWALASLVAGIFFLSVIALRILCLLPRLPSAQAMARPLADAELPVYSVLVPLFRETSVLGQLLTALTHLDYPALGSKSTKL